MLTLKDGTLLLHIKVVPNSSRTQIAGTLGNALKIKVAQPPENNKANSALLALLAQTLKIPQANLTLTAGHSRPQKTIQITGLDLPTAQTRLIPAN
jgi:hypothetical protein